MPVEGKTIGGDTVDFAVQTSTGLDSGTGTELPDSLPKQGDAIQITGCDGGTCPSPFLDTTKVSKSAVTVVASRLAQDQVFQLVNIEGSAGGTMSPAEACTNEEGDKQNVSGRGNAHVCGAAPQHADLRLGPANFFGQLVNGIRVYTSDFGGVADSTSRTYTVFNVGTAAAGKLAISLDGDLSRWQVENDHCTDQTLAKAFPGFFGGSCSFDVVQPAGGCPPGSAGQLDATNVNVNLNPRVNGAPELSLHVSNTCPSP